MRQGVFFGKTLHLNRTFNTMCGRLNITDNPAVHELAKALGLEIGPLPTQWNVAPTEAVPVIFHSDGKMAFDWMRWWLTPHWSDGPSQKFAMFNARSESIANSKAYRGPFKYRRCVVLADSFIEWQRVSGGKQPWLIEPDNKPLLLAAVWDNWQNEIWSCSILTQAADETFEAIHNRMPLALDLARAKEWLTADEGDENLLAIAKGFEPGYQLTRIEPTINNARNKEAPVSAH